MIAFRRGTFGVAAALSVGVGVSSGCDSSIDDEPGPSGGSAGSAGSGATDGGPTGPCQPTDPICYGNRPPSSPGSECMAAIDNAPGGMLAPRVQFRQTWNRSTAPIGNTEALVYTTLKTRAQLNLAQCNMPRGTGGYIQISDWDRSDPVITNQTFRTGYASYSSTAKAGSPPGPSIESVIKDGLCFLDWNYQCNQAPGCAAVTKPVPIGSLGRWPQALDQPWHVMPVTSKRLDKDFDVKDPAFRQEMLALPPGEGRIFIDETTGYIHGFSPLAYVTVLDNLAGGLATPIREAEVRSQFNDKSFNCLGRFRADKMDPSTQCDPGNVQTNPQWGCKDDAACPPAGFTDSKGSTGPGTTPSFTRGYFLIVDLERVWSNTLGSTLCVSYPGQMKSRMDGWADDSPTGWGLNCRGSSKWNPELPNDAGLPMGDWCSRTNAPAGKDAQGNDCHDAYLSESYSAAQAFKVKDATCSTSM